MQYVFDEVKFAKINQRYFDDVLTLATRSQAEFVSDGQLTTYYRGESKIAFTLKTQKGVIKNYAIKELKSVVIAHHKEQEHSQRHIRIRS